MLNFLITLQAMISDRMERDDKGATLVEYGLIVGIIVVIAAAALAQLGGTITAMFTEINTIVGNAF